MKKLLSTLAASFALAAPSALATAQPRQAIAVPSVGITVADLDRSIGFYADVLGFQPVSAVEEGQGPERERLEGVPDLHTRSVRMRLGDETIELTDYLAPESRPIPADSRSNDRWFQHVAIVVSDMREAYARLRAHHVRHASSNPQRLPDWNPKAGGIEAFYFYDPDGHVLEVIAFPPGKGDPRWQRKAGALFLGIDHTAIVVDDTERSRAFYHDLLGLELVGESENWGDEQEHLNNVFGAHLRISTLRAAQGPGVELLEYIAPAGGRVYPSDSRGNDLWHWETRMVVDDLDGLAARLRDSHAAFVSSGEVGFPDGSAALLVRDPDGHAVELWSAGPKTAR